MAWDKTKQKQVRISIPHHEKLVWLAEQDRRGLSQELEFLIDARYMPRKDMADNGVVGKNKEAEE